MVDFDHRKIVDTLNNHFVVDEVEDYNYKDFEMFGMAVDIVAVAVDMIVDMVVYIEVDIDFDIDFDINYIESIVDLVGNFEFQDIAEAVPFP